MNKKYLLNIFLLLFTINPIFSVIVTTQPGTANTGTPPPPEEPGLLDAVPWDLVWTIVGITILICLVGGVTLWIGLKIWKKINEDRRKKTDLEFFKFNLDEKMCHINADKKYMYRTWWTIWLGRRRAKIYALTELGRKEVGEYAGECVKKEGYMLIALYQKYTFFQRETDVVIFPYDLAKDMIKKNDDFTIDIVCEGIDEVLSSEYYSIPVISNQLNKQSESRFVDFSNEVMENYYRTYMYRDVIKNNISEFREGIKDATEMNPNIQHKRKSGGSLGGEN